MNNRLHLFMSKKNVQSHFLEPGFISQIIIFPTKWIHSPNANVPEVSLFQRLWAHFHWIRDFHAGDLTWSPKAKDLHR